MFSFVTVVESEIKDVENQKVDEDPITKIIGAIGKWQIWICFVVFLVKFPVAWHQMSIIFLAPPMNFTTSNTSGDFDNVCLENSSEYVYDHSIFQETIVSQWDLVCDRHWLKNLTQTIFMLGILVGNMLFGHLSDRSVPSNLSYRYLNIELQTASLSRKLIHPADNCGTNNLNYAEMITLAKRQLIGRWTTCKASYDFCESHRVRIK